MRKKLLAIGLTLAMTLSLAACGGSSATSTASKAASTAASKAASTAASKAESTAASKTESTAASTASASGASTKLTLILRGGTYADVIKKALPDFEKANNCTCEVLDLAFDDLHSKIALDAVNADGAYDLCMVDGSWMAEFTANNVLANLSDLGYTFDDDIIPATETICQVDGKIYLAPYFGNVTVMLYNKAGLTAAGYSSASDVKTWDDVKKIAKAGKDAGTNGYIVRGGSPDNIVSDFLPLLLAHGGWVVDDNNKPTVDTDEMKAALADYAELFSYDDTMDKDDIVAAIDGSKANLAIGWPGWYKPTSDSAGGYTVVPTKLTSDSKEYKTSLYGVWTVGICNNSKNKELAMKLLQYIMDPDTQLASVDNGGVPCRKSVLTNKDVLAKYPQYEIVYNALQSGTYRPVIEQWSDFTTILGTEIDNYLNKTKDADTAMKDAQSQLDTLLS